MPPPERPRQPTGQPDLEWILTDDGSRTLFDARLNETFHSGCGAVAETLIVYLLHSGVIPRLRLRLPSVVVEYGLGTATGFLLTAAMAEFYQTPLSYHAFECSLLPPYLLRQLELTSAVEQCLSRGFAKPHQGIDPEIRVEEFERLAHLVDTFCHAIGNLQSSDKPPTTPHITQTRLSEFVQIQLLLGDIRTMTQLEFAQIPTGGCDAIFFDPFSPETNPELWSAPVFRQTHSFLKSGGTFTSYCVKSTVRRELRESGFHVHKAPGPLGGKREVLIATKAAPCKLPILPIP